MINVVANLKQELAYTEERESEERSKAAHHTAQADKYSGDAIELRRAIVALEKAHG